LAADYPKSVHNEAISGLEVVSAQGLCGLTPQAWRSRDNTNLNERQIMLKKLGILMALAGMMCIAQAQQSLGDMVSGAGVDWLAGDWQAINDSGDTVFLGFKADLDNHIAFVHYKDQRSESKGIVMVDPGTGLPKYYAGNNQGGSGTGVWSVDGKKVILKYKHTAADGKTSRIGITFAKLDGESMEVKILALNDKDELGDDARWTGKFKRKK